MKSIITKLLVTILTIIIITNSVFVFISRKMSSDSLTAAINSSLKNLSSITAAEIRNINEQEFNLLESLSRLKEIKDPSIDLRNKYDMITEISQNDDSYIGMAIYDQTGTGWTTTGKYQNLSTREYLAESLKGQPYVMRPNWNPVNGQISTFYAMPFYDYNKKLEGVIVSVIDGTYLSTLVTNMKIGKKSHPYIIDMKTGCYVASNNLNDVKEGKNISSNKNPEFQKIITNICNGNIGNATYYNAERKETMLCVYRPVGGNCNWAVLCEAPATDFFGGLYTMLRILFAVFAVSTVIAVLLTGSLIWFSIRPLKTVDKAINTIATGNADLTQRIKVTSNDEIGSVVKGFNKFTERLHSIVSDIKQSKDDLFTAGEDLEAGTEDTASSITQIIANIESVNSQIIRQTGNVNETAGAVNEIASNIESFEKMIETQSSGITQASAAVEEMIGNINAVNQSVTKMVMSFDGLKDDAQSGSQKQIDVNERIEQIEQQSMMLQEANTAIANIAAQTNLLAMNAAIEAAHAGEAGKGFSVVADEIRKLSETSTGQSKTIGNQLKKIKESIESVVDASAQSNAAFLSVSNKIKDTDELVRQIKSAMNEQTEGSKQINEALRSMNDSTSEVRTAATEMAEGNKTILQEIKELQESTSVMKESVSEMSAGAAKINETGSTLSEVSSKMKTSISKIGNQIDQFKV